MGKTPQDRYDAANAVHVSLKFNRKNDADVLDRLAKENNKQAFIKGLIRNEIKEEKTMKIYGNEKTNLILTEKAQNIYSNCDPLNIIEHDDGTYSLRGIEDRDGMSAGDVIAWLEDLADEMMSEAE